MIVVIVMMAASHEFKFGVMSRVAPFARKMASVGGCNPKETYPRKDPVVYLDKRDLARRYQLPKATVAAFLA